MGLFNKAAIFTDIHFGKKRDSEEHNKDCVGFIKWFAENVKKENADMVIFCGDWFDNRIRTENRTGEYSRQAIEILNGLNLPIIWILGNHDIYYTSNRDIHSLPHSNQYSNITLIEEITTIDDVVFSPWLINDEYNKLINTKGKYVFAHLELPLFLQNQSHVKEYNKGDIHPDMFDECDVVYSGHYHKRQVKNNKHGVQIHYIGNCFPHDFNDLNDNERGMAILNWGDKRPNFIYWENSPSYHRITTTELLKTLAENNTYPAKSVIELIDDLDLSSDDLNDLRTILHGRQIIPKKLAKQTTEIDLTAATQYNSLDEMIIDLLKNLNYGGNYDPNLLCDLYMSI
jgi:DNA repair exonuclease SbcCD nuclease subunit